ncbi:MAG: phytanoyl-CoA dioxygenase family protein [Mycobacterium sp.]|uniref:phytanoyl-CoA dioxygenase family protein n=1 Tax=Mycobacterium sp. TaxID=1785 RepID=UPI001EB6FA5F|nr:phytanoyl-CoA dioxygenase family protein [Mycobacterium sp.]MBV8786787.1 phytanoyl-CoA dioxygenase family protein [Mycobacterium sp.]MBV9997039.1 phytanoyl-CoA dioxygenase family protein [Caulobacteraceae bacterium]
MNKFGAYGVIEPTLGPTASNGRIAEDLVTCGYSILPDVLSGPQLDELSEKLDDIYKMQCAEIGGEHLLDEILDADIVRCPLAYDGAFLSLSVVPEVISALKSILGDNIVLLMQNGVINRPNRIQTQTRWHRDLNYQHWVSSAPLAISVLFCLQDFNQETGGTVVLPSSHKAPHLPLPHMIQEHETQVEAPKGSAVIFDSMLFHRSGINRSDHIRRGVNHVVGRPILAQQIDISALLGQPPPEDAWLAGYLGYRWKPAADVQAWRWQRLEQQRSAADHAERS